MRIAALYDIHGNFLALDAVLAEFSADDVDHVVIGGDVVWGPHPGEVMDRLSDLELPVTVIRGNADREVCEGLPPDSDPQLIEITQWCAQQLGERRREWFRSLPLSAAFDVDGLGDTLFCHASPRSDEEIVTAITPETRFLEALSSARETVIVCGHTHMQFDRAARGRRLINPGSVGMPYEGRRGAYWAFLSSGVQFRRSDYDVEEAARRMRASGCPHVEEVFIHPMLNPLDKDDTIRHFESLATERSRSS